MKDEEYSNVSFAIIGGSYIDFSIIDLTPWGIQGGLIESEKTEKHIKEISYRKFANRNWSHIIKIAQSPDGTGEGKHVDWQIMNILWPIDLDNPPKIEDYFDAIGAIKVIHPSEVHILSILEAQYFKGEGIYYSGWSTYDQHYWNKYSDPHDHYLNYPEELLGDTNKFLGYYHSTYKEINYIDNAIKYYLDSFNVNSPEMAFLCLCICLETIVQGKEQLSYKFKRNLAVLCGETLEKAKNIYRNADKIYSFRSNLVHAGKNKKDNLNFDAFLEYTQILASRMIIEMLKHQISDITEFNNRLNELGFGDMLKISPTSITYKVNVITLTKIYFTI